MAVKSNSIQQKKEHAYILYTKEGVTEQKTLAERVGVSKQTINKWVNSENWERQRQSLIVTAESELRRFYMQVTELNDFIMKREEGKRFANSKEADTLVKLSGAIKNLEQDVSLGETMQVLKKFIGLVSKENLNEAKLITKWADIFIKTLLK
ncbi:MULTISPECIES: YfeC-like transcriptional regulator [Olivibacter]|uniref:YfeC-like transcriptional regulator n=1 Tax=Olivibacter jilunii TaxID=985016 RepID=A0ABW6AWF2_9SPHI